MFTTNCTSITNACAYTNIETIRHALKGVHGLTIRESCENGVTRYSFYGEEEDFRTLQLDEMNEKDARNLMDVYADLYFSGRPIPDDDDTEIALTDLLVPFLADGEILVLNVVTLGNGDESTGSSMAFNKNGHIATIDLRDIYTLALRETGQTPQKIS